MNLPLCELLLDLAREVRLPRALLVIPPPGSTMGERQFRRIALALEFEKQQPALKVRALVEEWGLERIVRELY